MDVTQDELERLAAQVGTLLQLRRWRLATAESCTGGWVAQTVTAIPGSSAWFDRGFVTYSNEAKREMLGVQAQTLAAFGAVSEATVGEMASGALTRSQAEAAIAISGIAGPSGGSADKPVGTVCFAWALAGRTVETTTRLFHGDRRVIRAQSVRFALQGLLDRLQ